MGIVQSLMDNLTSTNVEKVEKDAYGFLKHEENYENILDGLKGKRQREKIGEEITTDDVLYDIKYTFKNEIEKYKMNLYGIKENYDDTGLVSYSIMVSIAGTLGRVVFNGEPGDFAIRLRDDIYDSKSEKAVPCADAISIKRYNMKTEKEIIELGKMIRDGIDKNLEQIEHDLVLLKVNDVPKEFGITNKQLSALSDELNQARERKKVEKMQSNTKHKKDRRQDTVDEFRRIFNNEVSKDNIERAEKLLNCVKSYDYKKYDVSDKDIESATEAVEKIRKEIKNKEVPSIDQIEENNTYNKENIVDNPAQDIVYR